jgi:hypothetical protein
MKNKSILILMLFFYASTFSQTQYGFILEANSTNINTEDLINVNSKIGFGIGFSTLSPLHKSADFIGEITYTNKFIELDGYKNFSNNAINFPSTVFKNEDFNLNLIYNQYLIIPDLKKINLSLQVGYGLSFLNNWTLKDGDNNTILDRDGTINSIIITGISTGTEKLRFSLRYNIELSNALKDIYVNDIPDSNNNYERREFEGKQNNITFSITYFINNFSF